MDLIDRQAAIDELISEPPEMNYGFYYAVKIKALPPAQPSPCEFCKHNNIADDKACLMCSAERRTDEGSD